MHIPSHTQACIPPFFIDLSDFKKFIRTLRKYKLNAESLNPLTDDPPMKKNSNSIFHWGIGILSSTLIIWAMVFFFKNSLQLQTFDQTIGEYVPTPGSIVTWRSEGWADSHYGQHGFALNEEALVLSARPKFILWGDSHAESLQVPDNKKISAQFNAISSETPYACITYGRSGATVADYYYAIPRYEKALKGIVGHVILLSGMDDVLPNIPINGHGQFLSSPWALTDKKMAPGKRKQFLKSIARTLRLGPFYYLLTSQRLPDLRLTRTQAPQSTQRPPADSKSYNLEEGWRFLLQSLKQQSSGFLVFIYCPKSVPSLKHGRIQLKDTKADLVERFHTICTESGVGFIDTTKRFTQLYLQKKTLPRGFFNSPPGTGHMNEYGLKIIAESLRDSFQGVRK